MEKVDFTQGILAIQPDLHRFAYKLTADRESANDLVQDCLLQALDNQEKFTYSKNLKGWMYTLMRNIFVNNYRRTVREMNLIDDSYSINQQHLIEDEDADRFEFTYDMKQLYRVIHSIPEEMKVPFQMFVAGFKYREIAEKLGLPMGTVKSRCGIIHRSGSSSRIDDIFHFYTVNSDGDNDFLLYKLIRNGVANLIPDLRCHSLSAV